ncbi:MAG: GAF domain-containing protein [Cyanobacteria bacterium J06638_6]
MDQGLVGAVAARKQPMTIPGDRAAEPHLDFTPMVDPTLSDSQGDRSAQRTFSVTALPLLNPAHQLVAVVQVTNKLQPTSNPRAPLVDRVDPNGFTSEDVATLTANTVAIQLVLESFCSYHKTAQGQRVATALMTSTQSSRGRRVDPTELIGRIIEAATDLINADRGTLWLLDGEHQILWTQVLNQAGVSQTLQVPVGQGFAGKVAATATGINVPFDVYNHPESAQAQATDRQSGYRTYSLLCMPIFNPDGDLIGVTQLINKRRSRPSVPPHPGDHLLLPAESYVSFDDSDRKCLHIFNYQVGILLQHAELLATVQQQEAALISPQQ